jgi:hypothetical protein
MNDDYQIGNVNTSAEQKCELAHPENLDTIISGQI